MREDLLAGTLVQRLGQRFLDQMRYPPSESEVRSWDRSLSALSDVLVGPKGSLFSPGGFLRSGRCSLGAGASSLDAADGNCRISGKIDSIAPISRAAAADRRGGAVGLWWVAAGLWARVPPIWRSGSTGGREAEG